MTPVAAITSELLRSLRRSYSPHGSYTERTLGSCDVIDLLLRVLGEDPLKRPPVEIEEGEGA